MRQARTARDDDALDEAEIDLAGALNALAKNGVSISETRSTPSDARRGGGPAIRRAGGRPRMRRGARGLRGRRRSTACRQVSRGKTPGGRPTGRGPVKSSTSNGCSTDCVPRRPATWSRYSQPDQSLRLLSMAETYQAAGMFTTKHARRWSRWRDESRHGFRAAAALGRLLWRAGGAVGAALRWIDRACGSAPRAADGGGGACVNVEREKSERKPEWRLAPSRSSSTVSLGEQGSCGDLRQHVDEVLAPCRAGERQEPSSSSRHLLLII